MSNYTKGLITNVLILPKPPVKPPVTPPALPLKFWQRVARIFGWTK